MRSCSKHPRAYGDTPSSGLGPETPSGAPPRVRGHPAAMDRTSAAPSSTPARTGTPRAGQGHEERYHKHPRAYGDTNAASNAMMFTRQAPPRVRGHLVHRHARRQAALQAPPRVRGHRRGHRRHGHVNPSTPARTGTPTTDVFIPPYTGKHPRAYGDTHSLPRLDRPYAQAPPRVRGHPQGGHAQILLVPSTPARTGTPQLFQFHHTHPRKHPRAYGDTLDAPVGGRFD